MSLDSLPHFVLQLVAERLDRSALLPFALSSRGCLAAVQHCLQALQEASGLEGQLVYLNNKAAPTQALKSVSVCVLPTPRLQALFANPCITPADLRSAWEALAKQTAAAQCGRTLALGLLEGELSDTALEQLLGRLCSGFTTRQALHLLQDIQASMAPILPSRNLREHEGQEFVRGAACPALPCSTLLYVPVASCPGWELVQYVPQLAAGGA